MAASPPNQSLLRVRNESIYYIILIDRTKPDNSVRINPAARHSETIYRFVVLTGDMIFKDLFVGMKLLLRHERLSYAAANSHQNQTDLPGFKDKAARRLTRSQTSVVLSPRGYPGHTSKGRQCGDGCRAAHTTDEVRHGINPSANPQTHLASFSLSFSTSSRC